MAKFIINGGNELKGTIQIPGAKNSALILLAASILASTKTTLTNVPDISDIQSMIGILRSIGAKVEKDGDQVTIDPTNITKHDPDPALIKKLRASIVVVGPILAKFGKSNISQPGGCLIGARPVDDHIDLFKQLGVKVTEEQDCFKLCGKPQAKEIVLNKMSVTATENAIMASVLTPGKTIIHLAAAEPEIADLANYLNKMGAKIIGAGTHDIEIEGVTELLGATHKIISDRIAVGTYLMAALATNSELKIGPVEPYHLAIVLRKLQAAGAKFDIIEENGEKYIQTKKHGVLTGVDIDTRTYPGFPTDLQSPYTVLMTQAKGETKIFETIFEGRFRYADALIFMGADIEITSPYMVVVNGPTELKPKTISSNDIRGGAALVIAALIAKGETTITDIEYIDRGYDRMDEKLKAVGAKIKRVE